VLGERNATHVLVGVKQVLRADGRLGNVVGADEIAMWDVNDMLR
jgi:hypothetical protein